MDFESLAEVYMRQMHKMRQGKTNQEIHDSVRGENIILFYICKRDGQATPGDVSGEMKISSARTAAALNSLEKKGLIERHMDPNDRRKTILKVTDTGRQKSEKHREKMLAGIRNMLEYLGEEDAAAFVRITGRLSNIDVKEFFPKE